MPDIRTLIADIAARAGLDPDKDIEVTGAAGKLEGMVITNFGPARQSLEPLLLAFFLDVAESDGQVKFVPRGGESVATIGEDDLVPMTDGAITLLVTRQQEADLPRRIDVSYVAPDADWAAGTQSARRMVGGSDNAAAVNLPLALSDAKAREIADALLYDAWVTRESFTFQVTSEFAWLQPGDVVTLDARGTVRQIRLRKTDTDGLLVRLEGVPDDPEAYTSSSEAGQVGREGRVWRVIPATAVFLLDLPALRDQDDDPGFYVAASIAGADPHYRWRGAVLYHSTDGGSSYQALADLRGPATWGTCQTVLPEGPCTHWDEQAEVTVLLHHGQIESRGAPAVLNGANAALVGQEIIQFRDAVLTGPNTYRLRGLLRGRKGSEHHAGGHGANEPFLLLTSYDLVRVTLPLAAIGAVRHYKGVTVGLALESADALAFTCRGAALKPYSPAHVRGARNAAGDWTITWVRRTRLGGGWIDGADVALGEETERYEVDVLDDAGAVRRTLTAGQPGIVYSAAMQTADFGGAQDRIRVRIHQISATVGRGVAREVHL